MYAYIYIHIFYYLIYSWQQSSSPSLFFKRWRLLEREAACWPDTDLIRSSELMRHVASGYVPPETAVGVLAGRDGGLGQVCLTDHCRCSSSSIPSQILSAGSIGTNNSTCSS